MELRGKAQGTLSSISTHTNIQIYTLHECALLLLYNVLIIIRELHESVSRFIGLLRCVDQHEEIPILDNCVRITKSILHNVHSLS